MTKNERLRELLAQPGALQAPGCIDPFTARIIQDIGFNCCYIGGYATGTHYAISEPLVTLTEQVGHAANIARVLDVPLIVDAGAGFGDPVHTARTIREFERAGISGIHIEDQIYPKKMHYHTLPAPTEHVIPVEEMVMKIKAGVEARRDPNFVLIARTDAIGAENGGIKEAIRRGNLFAEAGADLVLMFPVNDEQTELIPKEVDAPLAYIYSEGTHRPRYTKQELSDMGWKLIIYASTTVMVIGRAIREVMTELYTTGRTSFNNREMAGVREQVQAVIGIPELIALEKATRAEYADAPYLVEDRPVGR